jgi:hypothetical protein
LSPLCLLSFPFLLNGSGGAFPRGTKLVQLQLLWSFGFDEFVDPHIFIYEQIKIESVRSRFLLNKYRERRATMRFNEIASADDQLALWRLISDNVWSAVLAQAKAQAAATPKPKRIQPKKIVPKKPPAPKPKPPAPKLPPPKSPVPQQARVVTPSRPPPLPSSQPVLRPTHSSSFSQADAYGLQQQTMGPSQGTMPR